MAVEARRRCGYRTIGGIYLVAPPGGYPCGRLPIPLRPCPECSHEPRFNRNLTKIRPGMLLHSAPACRPDPAVIIQRPWPDRLLCGSCPFDAAFKSETGGLLWVGLQNYPTVADFAQEEATLGISRRLATAPGPWLELGKTWIFLAHPLTVVVRCRQDGQEMGFHETCPTCRGRLYITAPGVFKAFLAQRIEIICPDNMPAEELARLSARGLTPVLVPHDDPDHQPGARRPRRGQMTIDELECTEETMTMGLCGHGRRPPSAPRWHSAPAGQSFCSELCERCEQESTSHTGCDNICGLVDTRTDQQVSDWCDEQEEQGKRGEHGFRP